MFTLSEKATVRWPVVYRVPKDGGGFDEHPFLAEYKLLNQRRIDEIFDTSRKMVAGELPVNPNFDRDLLEEVFVTWHEIRNPDRTEFEDSAANRDYLLNLPGMRAMLVSGFFETVGGGAERKNSKPPRSSG